MATPELLQEGKKAPAFNLPDKDGEKHRLSAIDADYTVVYFYPKDNTPGCTTEALEFTRLEKKFDKAGTRVLGISGGDEKSKTKFCSKHSLTVTLLSDTDFSVSEKYGVYGLKKFMGKEYKGISRATYVLDSNKKVIKTYPKVKAAGHAQEVLDFINSQAA